MAVHHFTRANLLNPTSIQPDVGSWMTKDLLRRPVQANTLDPKLGVDPWKAMSGKQGPRGEVLAQMVPERPKAAGLQIAKFHPPGELSPDAIAQAARGSQPPPEIQHRIELELVDVLVKTWRRGFEGGKALDQLRLMVDDIIFQSAGPGGLGGPLAAARYFDAQKSVSEQPVPGRTRGVAFFVDPKIVSEVLIDGNGEPYRLTRAKLLREFQRELVSAALALRDSGQPNTSSRVLARTLETAIAADRYYGVYMQQAGEKWTDGGKFGYALTEYAISSDANLPGGPLMNIYENVLPSRVAALEAAKNHLPRDLQLGMELFNAGDGLRTVLATLQLFDVRLKRINEPYNEQLNDPNRHTSMFMKTLMQTKLDDRAYLNQLTRYAAADPSHVVIERGQLMKGLMQKMTDLVSSGRYSKAEVADLLLGLEVVDPLATFFNQLLGDLSPYQNPGAAPVNRGSDPKKPSLISMGAS